MLNEAKIQDTDYEYEEDIIDEDFAEEETQEKDEFDYDGYRMHKYDDYTGEITYEIAVEKYETLVRHYAAKYMSNEADYEELVQEGLIKLQTLIEKCENKKTLNAYLKKSLKCHICKSAKRLREQANRDNCISLDIAQEPLTEAVGYDWHEREVAMFRKVKSLLTQNEMQILSMIYKGYSVRMTARIRNVSHTAIENSIARIRKKLTPLKPWLEDKTEFPCTEAG